MQGQLHRAEAYYQEASAFLEQVGNWRDVARELEQTGSLLLALGRFDKAYWMLEKLLAINRDLGLNDRVAYTMVQLGLAEAQLGRYKRASARAWRCLQLSEEIGYTRGIGLSSLLLGLVEVATGSALEARSRLLDCINVYQELGAGWMPSVIHSILGIAERNLADTTQAWQRACTALSIAVDCQSSGPALLYPVAAISLLLADRGEIERAVELYALASQERFVANSKWFADVIGTQIADRAAELPAPIIAAAQRRGRHRDLEATAMELVKEFLTPRSHHTDWRHTRAGGAVQLIRPRCQMC
jgi:tetratricopeptide (TPR) repeat protein